MKRSIGREENRGAPSRRWRIEQALARRHLRGQREVGPPRRKLLLRAESVSDASDPLRKDKYMRVAVMNNIVRRP